MRSTIVSSALLATFALGAASTVSLTASAQPSAGERAMAETLFREGKRLLAEGKISEACEKLAASYKIDEAGGTLLNLADCHEREGRLTTAWTEFQEALAKARTAGREDRQQAASERIGKLEPRLSTIKVNVARGAQVGGFVVRLDGVAVASSLIGSSIPVDPGEHKLVASAPGKKPWEARIRIKEAEAMPVLVPELDAADVVLPAEPAEPVEALPPPLPPPDSEPTKKGGAWKTPLGITFLAAGAASIGVGTFFGVRALGKGSDAKDQCPDKACSPAGLQSVSDGRSAATLADVTLIAGGAAAVTGIVFLALGGSGPPNSDVKPDVKPAPVPAAGLKLRPIVVAGPGLTFLGAGGVF